METLKVRGVVFSGKGEGAKFMNLSEVRNQIKEKLGFIPYPGTLNLKLTAKEIPKRALLKEIQGIEIDFNSSLHTGIVFEARLENNLQCGIVIPQTPDYPEDMIELIAPTGLRRRLKLTDGDLVEIEIMME